MIEQRKKSGLPNEWKSGAEFMQWWMRKDNRMKDNDGSISLFGLILDESDT